MAAAEPVLLYHSWNANGIDEVKIRCMMPIWKGADFVFIQETKLASSKEAEIAGIARAYGFGCIFHAAIKSNPYSDYLRDGVCVFFKLGIEVKHCVMEKAFPEIEMNDQQRIMLIRFKSEMIENEWIYFVNLYFPSHHSADPERDAERDKWLNTIDVLSEKLSNEHAIWLGDFNAMKLNNVLVPAMVKSDHRCKIFSRMEEIFGKHNFLNVTEKLWPNVLYTRYGFRDGNMIVSRLDYVIASQRMQNYSLSAEPVYNEQVFLSDHINLKCSIRVASENHPAVHVATKITCEVPMTVSIRNRKCPYDNCGKVWPCPTDLVKHIRSHTGERPFVCNKNCGFRTAQKSGINRHQSCCNGPIVLIQCPDCPAKTPIQAQFDEHRKTCVKKQKKFDRNAKFICTKCFYSTNNSGHWCKHIESPVHNNEKCLQWYYCLTCNFFTVHQKDLDRHNASNLHMRNTVED